MTWHVQRANMGANPPRFEWLRAKPDFYPAGATLPDQTIAAEDTVITRWTWQDATDQSGWRNGNAPRDFQRRARAEKWAAVVGDGAIAVRMGEPDADESPPDPVTEARERLREARRAYREAVAAGLDDGQ